MTDTLAESRTGRPGPRTEGPSRERDLLQRLLSRVDEPPIPFELITSDGRVLRSGDGPPEFTVEIRNSRGLKAFRSLHQLRVADAYIAGDLDFKGDLVAAIMLKDELSDRAPWLKLWRWLAPALFGRERFNPGWVQKHYDSGNIQLLAADRDYNTYTPGIYDGASDTLEAGAERKLASAYEALGLGPGSTVLDVGCGWGGFLRYAARRGTRVTGLTLSRDQLAYDQALIREEGLPARVLYQDFFTYEPERRFDGISMMGVIEDLSDYPRVFRRLKGWIKPGGRIYLDFGTAPERVATGSFVTKHIWPGTFRLVYLPELVEALVGLSYEIVSLDNDRANYHQWARGLYDRWMAKEEEVLERANAEIWRMFRMLFAGCAAMMSRPLGKASAARLVIEAG